MSSVGKWAVRYSDAISTLRARLSWNHYNKVIFTECGFWMLGYWRILCIWYIPSISIERHFCMRICHKDCATRIALFSRCEIADVEAFQWWHSYLTLVYELADGGGGCVFGDLALLLRLFHTFRWKHHTEVSYLRSLLPGGKGYLVSYFVLKLKSGLRIHVTLIFLNRVVIHSISASELQRDPCACVKTVIWYCFCDLHCL